MVGADVILIRSPAPNNIYSERAHAPDMVSKLYPDYKFTLFERPRPSIRITRSRQRRLHLGILLFTLADFLLSATSFTCKFGMRLDLKRMSGSTGGVVTTVVLSPDLDLPSIYVIMPSSPRSAQVFMMDGHELDELEQRGRYISTQMKEQLWLRLRCTACVWAVVEVIGRLALKDLEMFRAAYNNSAWFSPSYPNMLLLNDYPFGRVCEAFNNLVFSPTKMRRILAARV